MERTRSRSCSISRNDASKWFSNASMLSNTRLWNDFSRRSSQRCSMGLSSGAYGGRETSLMLRGIVSKPEVCHPAPSRIMMIRSSGMSGSYFIEKYLHQVAVDVRENQTVELAVNDRNGAVGIGIFLRYHAVAERTGRFRAPAPPSVGDAAETRFILEHYPEWPFFAPLVVDLRDDLGEFFFHSSWASISAFGCRLSGASFLQP